MTLVRRARTGRGGFLSGRRLLENVTGEHRRGTRAPIVPSAAICGRNMYFLAMFRCVSPFGKGRLRTRQDDRK